MTAIKTIAVDGNPDGLTFDAGRQRVYVLSHTAPASRSIAPPMGW